MPYSDTVPYKAIAEGCKSFGDSWISWWLYPRLTDDEANTIAFDVLDLSWGNGGPGQVYERKPIIRHSRNYTLIRQSAGLDV